MPLHPLPPPPTPSLNPSSPQPPHCPTLCHLAHTGTHHPPQPPQPDLPTLLAVRTPGRLHPCVSTLSSAAPAGAVGRSSSWPAPPLASASYLLNSAQRSAGSSAMQAAAPPPPHNAAAAAAVAAAAAFALALPALLVLCCSLVLQGKRRPRSLQHQPRHRTRSRRRPGTHQRRHPPLLEPNCCMVPQGKMQHYPWPRTHQTRMCLLNGTEWRMRSKDGTDRKGRRSVCLQCNCCSPQRHSQQPRRILAAWWPCGHMEHPGANGMDPPDGHDMEHPDVHDMGPAPAGAAGTAGAAGAAARSDPPGPAGAAAAAPAASLRSTPRTGCPGGRPGCLRHHPPVCPGKAPPPHSPHRLPRWTAATEAAWSGTHHKGPAQGRPRRSWHGCLASSCAGPRLRRLIVPWPAGAPLAAATAACPARNDPSGRPSGRGLCHLLR
mmetsp:Transcript_12730/g.33783  ORF Transcript_12730/g.33783 Transcript_12730/m.33783 type:complete len:434 (-) Transcript_12730:370-1671(-)